MNKPDFYTQLTTDWSLGSPICPPQPVSGGYMHKMFRLDTTAGSYAVKLLNPEVMSRPAALSNYQKAEALESVLERHGLPIVAAMSHDGSKMQCIQGQYYYLFPWVEHQALPWDAISVGHCRTIGGLLAKLHNLPCGEIAPETSGPDLFSFDWQAMAQQTQKHCPELAATLAAALPLLEEAQASYNDAVNALPSIHCICNADMDSKNVLWQGSDPLMIDLECLEIGNPVNDLVQLSLSWAGGVLCQLNFDQLTVFLRAYREVSSLRPMDWTALSGLGFAWLDWLNYNLRRACGLTIDTPDERTIGIQESRNTLDRICYYAQMQPQVAQQFQRAMEG